MTVFRLLLIEISKRTKRALVRFSIALMLLPVLISVIGLLIRLFTSYNAMTWDMFPVMFFLYFLITLLISLGTVKEDVDDNSYVFVNILPFSKTEYYTARFFSSYILVYLSFLVSLVLFYVFSFLSVPGMTSELFTLWRYLLGFAFGLLAYCAVFAFFGVAFQKGTIYAILYLFIWESIFSYTFFFIEKLTISYYLRNILPSSSESGLKGLFLMGQSAISPMQAIAGLITIFLLFFAAGLFIYHKVGYLTGE